MRKVWTAFSLVMGILSLTLLCAAVNAQTVRVGGACLQVTSAAAAGDTSGVELEAGPRGAVIMWIVRDGGAGDYGMTISSASLFDQAVTTQAFSMVFGQGPVGSVARRGQDSAGALPADGDFIDLRTAPIDFQIYVPAGKFFTFRQMTVNTAAVVAFCFQEPVR